MGTRSRPAPGGDLPPLLDPERPAAHPFLRLACFLLGLACVFLGVAGWLLPVVTGIPFYLLGAWLLGLSSRRVRGWINALDARLPHRLRCLLRRLRPGRFA